jgi:DNA-3-methyladenine glycosylase II
MIELPEPERFLSKRDPVLAKLIARETVRWPSEPTEEPIWGLLRIVMAQQLSTALACRLAERVRLLYPDWATGVFSSLPDVSFFRDLGLPQRRAECCLRIAKEAAKIKATVSHGLSWEQVLSEFKGVGPWTIAVFRIMVLRDPDVFPVGDVGLNRAIQSNYSTSGDVSVRWAPYRSVACWYLWRTLGNQQLG